MGASTSTVGGSTSDASTSRRPQYTGINLSQASTVEGLNIGPQQ